MNLNFIVKYDHSSRCALMCLTGGAEGFTKVNEKRFLDRKFVKELRRLARQLDPSPSPPIIRYVPKV